MRAFVDLFEQRESLREAQVAVRTEERDDAIRRLVAFERIATAALVTSDPSAFLRELCSIFIATAEAADSVCLFIRDGDHLKQEACLGLNEKVDERVVVRLDEGFAGKIAVDGAPHEIAGACTSPLVKSPWLRERGTNALYAPERGQPLPFVMIILSVGVQLARRHGLRAARFNAASARRSRGGERTPPDLHLAE